MLNGRLEVLQSLGARRIVSVVTGLLVLGAATAFAAQTRLGPEADGGQLLHRTQTADIKPQASADDGRPPEGVEVDVSARSVAVTSTFAGTEIVAFGAVERSRQSSPEAGYYDVVIVFSGKRGEAVVRRKSRVAGVWVNTNALTFDDVPSFYGIVSSRKLFEIADAKTLSKLHLGFEDLKLKPVLDHPVEISKDEIAAYKSALIRLKVDDGLFVSNDYGLAFVGKSLFRATVHLPANIPIGTLTATTYLFRNGTLLNSHETHLKLERQGSERVIYSFARNYPLYYGIISVIIAIISGIGASALFPTRDR